MTTGTETINILVCEDHSFLGEQIVDMLTVQDAVRSVMLTDNSTNLKLIATNSYVHVILSNIVFAIKHKKTLKDIMSIAPGCLLAVYADETTDIYRQCAEELGASCIISKADMQKHIDKCLKRTIKAINSKKPGQEIKFPVLQS